MGNTYFKGGVRTSYWMELQSSEEVVAEEKGAMTVLQLGGLHSMAEFQLHEHGSQLWSFFYHLVMYGHEPAAMLWPLKARTLRLALRGAMGY